MLTVYNPQEGLTQEDVKHLFDRFYRGDSSRSTGGFGIGLSMASAIVAAHKGKISAVCTDGIFTVTVLLPA